MIPNENNIRSSLPNPTLAHLTITRRVMKQGRYIHKSCSFLDVSKIMKMYIPDESNETQNCGASLMGRVISPEENQLYREGITPACPTPFSMQSFSYVSNEPLSDSRSLSTPSVRIESPEEQMRRICNDRTLDFPRLRDEAAKIGYIASFDVSTLIFNMKRISISSCEIASKMQSDFITHSGFPFYNRERVRNEIENGFLPF